MVAAVAALLPLTAMIQVLAELRDYRQPVVPVAVWLGVLAAAVWLVPRARAGGFTGAEAAAAVAIAVAAVTAAGWERRAHFAPGSVDLSVLGTVWLLVLVELSRSAWAWISGALLVFAVRAAFVIRDTGPAPLSFGQLAAAGYVIVVIVVAFAALRPTLATYTSIAARRAALASKSAAERAAAAAIGADRRDRLALMEREALPLLRGIADGTLDPADARVRERCARYAVMLRHSLTDRAPSAGGVWPGLEPVLRAASARGMLVDVQVIGNPGHPAAEVADAVRAAVGGVISALPPHPVTLTVLAPGDDVELYLIFGEPPRTVPDLSRLGQRVPAAARWHAAANIEETGAGSLEICWRKEGRRED
jgi:hypothetical protein